MQQNAIQNRIEVNTRTTAEATQRAAVGIARMADALTRRQGQEVGRELTAGN